MERGDKGRNGWRKGRKEQNVIVLHLPEGIHSAQMNILLVLLLDQYEEEMSN